jgi:hypothetical protein
MTKYFETLIPQILLEYFPTDKILHFSISFILIFTFFWVRKFLLKQKWHLRILAFSLRDVLIIWLTKEIIDFLWFWNAEFLDFVADFWWAIIPIYLFFIIKLSSQLKKSRKLQFEKNLITKFKNSENIWKKIKILIYLSIIWFLNIFYLILKIPFLALKETYYLLKVILKK